MESPVFSVLVVGYNSGKFLDAVMTSILATTYPYFEILFLDNHSPESEGDYVESHFLDKRVRVFRSPRNLLFAGGMNFLAQSAQGKFLVLLNPDACVEPDWLSVLNQAQQEQGWGAAQLDLRDASDPERYETQGVHIDRLGFISHVHRPGADRPFRIFSGRGAGVMFNRHQFLTLGGLDEDMGMYFEETDYFWRLNLVGTAIYFVPNAKVYHVRGGSSTPGGFDWKVFRFTRNRILSLVKNLQLSNLLVYLPIHFAIYLLRVPALFLCLQWQRAAAEFAAILCALAWLPHFAVKRKGIQALRKLSDAELIRAGLLLDPSKPTLFLKKLFGYRPPLNPEL